jgi:hypothetical protein
LRETFSARNPSGQASIILVGAFGVKFHRYNLGRSAVGEAGDDPLASSRSLARTAPAPQDGGVGPIVAGRAGVNGDTGFPEYLPNV